MRMRIDKPRQNNATAGINHLRVSACASFDLVEVDPTKDMADTTVLAAASFFLAFASGVATRYVK